MTTQKTREAILALAEEIKELQELGNKALDLAPSVT